MSLVCSADAAHPFLETRDGAGREEALELDRARSVRSASSCTCSGRPLLPSKDPTVSERHDIHCWSTAELGGEEDPARRTFSRLQRVTNRAKFRALVPKTTVATLASRCSTTYIIRRPATATPRAPKLPPVLGVVPPLTGAGLAEGTDSVAAVGDKEAGMGRSAEEDDEAGIGRSTDEALD